MDKYSNEDDKTLWEGRQWLKYYNKNDVERKRSFSVLSYHVFADCKISSINHSVTRNWDLRSLTLIQELRSYNADILCLQDVDHFTEWWRPQLMLLGYDSVFKKRTEVKDFRSEGVIIAYKNDLFQLFKTVPIEFNQSVQNNERGSVFRARSITDDVGLLLFLQPYTTAFSTAVCVASAMLSCTEADSDVRMVQCQYLTEQIERSNRDFQVPVVIGVSMHDSPSSLAYNVLRSGRIPLLAQVPKQCRPPYGKATCRGSILMKWLPPVTSLADPPINEYRICWRPGGSRVLGYSAERKVSVGDCVRYVKQVDADNNVKIVTLKELECIISGLTSDVPYEFKIAAINDMGEGIMSDPSDPIVMHNASTAPAMPELVSFSTLASLIEGRELSRMQQNDWNAYSEVKNNEVLNSATQMTPRTLDGMKTRQVPRGSVLPIGINPRAGWKDSLGVPKDPVIKQDLARESVLCRSLLRNRVGFKNPGFNQYSETLVPYTATDSEKNEEEKESGWNEDDEDEGSHTGHRDSTGQSEGEQDEDDNSKAFSIEKSVGPNLSSLLQTKSSPLVSLPISLESVSQLDKEEGGSSAVDTPTTETKDNSHMLSQEVHHHHLQGDYLLDGRECMEHIGGEPMYTTSSPVSRKNLGIIKMHPKADNSHLEGIQCFDYLFYSASGLVTEEVLSIPPISELRGETPTEPLTSPDAAYVSAFLVCGKLFDEKVKKIYTDLKIPVVPSSSSQSISVPPSRHTVNEFKRKLKEQLLLSYQSMEITKRDNNSNSTNNNGSSNNNNRSAAHSYFFGGRWSAFTTPNTERRNHFLPNDAFCSTHFAIGAKFSPNESSLSSQWR